MRKFHWIPVKKSCRRSVYGPGDKKTQMSLDFTHPVGCLFNESNITSHHFTHLPPQTTLMFWCVLEDPKPWNKETEDPYLSTIIWIIFFTSLESIQNFSLYFFLGGGGGIFLVSKVQGGSILERTLKHWASIENLTLLVSTLVTSWRMKSTYQQLKKCGN